MNRQLILTSDKQEDGTEINALIAVEIDNNANIGIPWNAQTISETVYDLMWAEISKHNGVKDADIEANKIDFIDFGRQLAEANNIEFKNQIV